MTNLNELLTVTFTDNYLYAKVVYKDGNKLTDISCTKQEVLEFLKGKNVTFGIVNEKIERFVDGISSGSLPLTVAEGYDKQEDRKSTRLNSSHVSISYAVFCLKK